MDQESINQAFQDCNFDIDALMDKLQQLDLDSSEQQQQQQQQEIVATRDSSSSSIANDEAKKDQVNKLCPLVQATGSLEVNKFDFNGFDLMKSLSKLLALIQKKKKNKVEAVRDLVDLVVIGLTRGNIRSDQVQRTSTDEGIKRIKELVAIYGIRQRSSVNERVNLKNDDFTFIRMTLLFPHMSAIILRGSPSIVKNGKKTELQSELLPDCMKFAGFSGLIPENLEKELFTVLKYASLAYQVDFSYLINPSLSNKTLKQVFDIQLPFWTAGNKGGWLTDAQRVTYLNALGINSVIEFTKIVKVASLALLNFTNSRINEEDVIKRHTSADLLIWPEELASGSDTSHQKLLTDSFAEVFATTSRFFAL